MEELLIFIVTEEGENGPVSATCETAVAHSNRLVG
jgi:hypothetical protein